MPSELEFTSIDAAKRVRLAKAYAEHGGFNRATAETYDPDPNSGSNGYDDDMPYPFSQDTSVSFETSGRDQTATFEDDSRGKTVRLALLVGSVILFVALVVLVVLSPW